MAYGGGIFSEQNKSLPGAYINFNTVASTTSVFGSRGTVAIALPISIAQSKVLEWTFEDFKVNCKSIFDIDWNETDNTKKNYWSVRAIRELFCNATKVIIGGLLNNPNGKSSFENEYFSATTNGNYDGYTFYFHHTKRDNGYDWEYKLSDENSNVIVKGSSPYGSSADYPTIKDAMDAAFANFNENNEIATVEYKKDVPDWSVFSRTETFTGANLTLSLENALNQHNEIIETLSKKSFNILACVHFDDTTEYDAENIKKAYDDFTKYQRDNYGVKFQTVYFDYPEANHESAISLSKENNKDLIFWTAGALAGASFAESLCNKTYDGELELSTLGADQDPATLENAIATGSFIFHKVGDSVRVLDDINTYINAGENKEKDPEIFNDNQCIRVIDQIGNDIATIFVNNYLGKIPSDDSGRSSFWNALVDYHNQMQDLGGIQNFTSSDISVTAGTQRNSVVVNEVITLGSTMKKLYMTVTVQ